MNRRWIPTTGFSMLPAIPPGIRLAVESRVPSAVAPGDVICYLENESAPIVAHRVVAVDTRSRPVRFITRGDTGLTLDSVPAHAVIGVVTHIAWRRVTLPMSIWPERMLSRFMLSTGFVPHLIRTCAATVIARLAPPRR